MTEKPALPNSPLLDIASFAGIFADKSASYKFLWMQAILRAVERNEAARPIPSRLLVAYMLDIAKYPLRRFLLSFGWHDRVDEVLKDLEAAAGWHPLRDANLDKEIAVRFADIPDFVSRPLLQFVPYRLLTPFFGDAMRGLGRAERNRKIAQFADDSFRAGNPSLYRFSKNGDEIELHPAWRNYIADNLEILKAWARWHWANYLQGRNPHAPAILSKLEKPDRRGALKKQTEFWRWIIGLHAGEIRCIYSDEILRAGEFSLDHYVPWDFIGHDFLWNLAPVKEAVNSAKSNRLPSDSYLPKLAEVQHIALSEFHAHRREKWSGMMESYLADLRLPLSGDSVPDRENLQAAYLRVIPPLLSLAENCGFRRWKYRSSQVS